MTFQQALTHQNPLKVLGVINAYCAMMAEKVGFQALYVSGGGVANIPFGLPDLGMTTLNQVAEEARRITAVTELPVLVDIDTGFGDIPNTIKTMISAGVAAVHIEDQIAAKRCGHRPGKQLVTADAMCDRVKACVDARTQGDFVIMARTDAFQSEGIEGATTRALRYVEAGADMIFAEAFPDIALYDAFCNAVKVPVLANMTEFGKTPLYTTKELGEHDVQLVLYPRSVERAMSQAGLNVMKDILNNDSQKNSVPNMQTRDDLYAFLDYLKYENTV